MITALTVTLVIMVVIELLALIGMAIRHKSDQEHIEALNGRIISLSEQFDEVAWRSMMKSPYLESEEPTVDMTTANGKPMFGIDPKTGKYA